MAKILHHLVTQQIDLKNRTAAVSHRIQILATTVSFSRNTSQYIVVKQDDVGKHIKR